MTSPMTGLVLPTKHVTPNYALKNVMEQWCALPQSLRLLSHAGHSRFRQVGTHRSSSGPPRAAEHDAAGPDLRHPAARGGPAACQKQPRAGAGPAAGGAGQCARAAPSRGGSHANTTRRGTATIRTTTPTLTATFTTKRIVPPFLSSWKDSTLTSFVATRCGESCAMFLSFHAANSRRPLSRHAPGTKRGKQRGRGGEKRKRVWSVASGCSSSEWPTCSKYCCYNCCFYVCYTPTIDISSTGLVTKLLIWPMVIVIGAVRI